MTRDYRPRDAAKRLGLAVAFFALTASGTTLTANASATRAGDSYPPYCDQLLSGEDCLKSISADIRTCKIKPSEMGLDLEFQNPNETEAPRDILVFRDGEEFFGDTDVAPPGTSGRTYGPLPAHKWQVVVSWDGLIFGEGPDESLPVEECKYYVPERFREWNARFGSILG